MKKTHDVHLTGLFEIGPPTNRKAALIESARSSAEEIFWRMMAANFDKAAQLCVLNKRDRNNEIDKIGNQTSLMTKQWGYTTSFAIVDGVARDVKAAISSYVELMINSNNGKGDEPSWPLQNDGQTAPDHCVALDWFVNCGDTEEYKAFHALLLKVTSVAAPRPFTLVRNRDCQIIRNKRGRLAVVLNIVSAVESDRKTAIETGIDAASHEPVKASIGRKTVVVLPLKCSLWHEHKFFSGDADLLSALVIRTPNDRWLLAAQFGFNPPKVQVSDVRIGIDRGCVYPIVAAVVDASGAVIAEPRLLGQEIAAAFKARSSMLKRQQQKSVRAVTRKFGIPAERGQANTRPGRRIDHCLHVITNEIVNLARQYRATIIIEKLDGLKRQITTKRQKGARHGGWGPVLKSMQMGKIERLLSYKLAKAGLPAYKEVVAGGSSQTCIACGYRAKENRLTRGEFKCIECGYTQHADINAAVVVGRRGILLTSLKKNDKLDVLHRNMVMGLSTRDDSGLGPLIEVDERIVATHVAAIGAYDPDGTYSVGGTKQYAMSSKTYANRYSQSVTAAI